MQDNNQKATLLIVDDTPHNIDVLRGILKDTYKIKVANDGEKALKVAFSEKKPDPWTPPPLYSRLEKGLGADQLTYGGGGKCFFSSGVRTKPPQVLGLHATRRWAVNPG